MINEYAKLTANTGIAVVNTANSNLDGTGTLSNVITGASNGTIIKSIKITMQSAAVQGIIRFFISDGASYTRLLEEIEIPPSAISSTTYPGYSKIIPLNYFLQNKLILMASTQYGDTYDIIAEGYDVSYP